MSASAPIVRLNPVASANALQFYWDLPADSGSSQISNYQLICSSIGFSAMVNAASTYASVGGLTNGQNYTFQVAASNINGTGPYTAFKISQPGLLPGGPRNLSLSTINSSTVNLYWNFSTNINEGGNQYFAVNVIPSYSTLSSYYISVYPDQRSKNITGLPSSFYTFKLYSINDAGWSQESNNTVVSSFVGTGP